MNDLTSDTLVMIINENCISQWKKFKYQLGLNIDAEFIKSDGALQDGFYYTSIKNIAPRFLSYGNTVALIKLEQDSIVYQIMEYDLGEHGPRPSKRVSKFQTNKLTIIEFITASNFLRRIPINLLHQFYPWYRHLDNDLKSMFVVQKDGLILRCTGIIYWCSEVVQNLAQLENHVNKQNMLSLQLVTK